MRSENQSLSKVLLRSTHCILEQNDSVGANTQVGELSTVLARHTDQCNNLLLWRLGMSFTRQVDTEMIQLDVGRA